MVTPESGKLHLARANQRREHRALAAAFLLAAAVSAASASVVLAGDAEPSGGAAAGSAAQQTPPNPAANAAGTLRAQPVPVEKHGFLDDFGNWWKQSFGDFGAKIDAARERIEDLNNKQNKAAGAAATVTDQALKDAAHATSDTATAIARLPSTRVLELSDRCEAAANGAPDCGAAATKACRQRGFTNGQVLDIRTSQECPAAVLASGRTPTEAECPPETVVLRAVCQ